MNIVRKAFSEGKIVAANMCVLCFVCVAPLILANAGILKDRKATCFPSVESSLSRARVECTGEDVRVDGRIITGSGPEAARGFGQAVLKALLG